jgi:hypothetical protein
MPRIAPTFLMMSIPREDGNEQCNGGNPAKTALALESIKIADTTCVDYSWCSNEKLCTSAAAAAHFSGNLGSALNDNIPHPGNACYYEGDRYLYQIDPGSEALFINDKMPPESFRKHVKKHILKYGPPLAGYAVYNNFVTGNFTDPSVNQGVYFERATYSVDISAHHPLRFDDRNVADANIAGMHAVEVVGWGLARNVQYDNDLYGDVPFWWAKNSWGSSWGNAKGYFKIAMYPWNRAAQFGKQIQMKDATVGGIILIRCTKPPTIGKLENLPDGVIRNIVKTMPESYYKRKPEDISGKKSPERVGNEPKDGRTLLICGALLIGVFVVIFGILSCRGG